MDILKEKRIQVILAAIVVILIVAYSGGWFDGGEPETETPTQTETTTQ